MEEREKCAVAEIKQLWCKMHLCTCKQIVSHQNNWRHVSYKKKNLNKYNLMFSQKLL